MKEFSTKEGGRKIYNEDFVNLQELVTSLSGFLADCNLNFVISGCDVTEDRVKEGYVFLEGQIRKVDETQIDASEKPVITPVTQVINKKYEDGNTSEIATIYGTKIIPSNKFVTGVGINGVVDNGSYHFKSIADTFWNAYTIVKNSEYPQNMDVLTKFVGGVFASNATLGKQGRAVTIEGNTISLYNNNNTILKLKISSNGEVSFENNDGNVLFKFNKNDETQESLNYVLADTLKTEIVSAQTLMLGSSNVKDTYFTIEEYADTGWHNLVRISTGEEIQGIKARAYLGMVHIQGTLPMDFFSKVTFLNEAPVSVSGYWYNVYLTDVKLPDCIPSPSSEYINSFQVITPVFGTVGANVFLKKKTKEFYLITTYSSNKVGELFPASEEGLARFSFPFYSLNNKLENIRKPVLGIINLNTKTDFLKFPDQSVCPSISWQYSADIQVELYSYTYSDSFYASVKFNPDSYILHIYSYMVRTSTRINLTTGEEKKGQYYIYPDVESISYYYCLIDENDKIISLPTNGYIPINLRYITDIAVNQYEGYYSKDKSPLTGSNKWTSNGYDISAIKSVPKTVKAYAKEEWFDKISIKVQFKDTEYFTGKSYTLNIYGMDAKFHLGLDTHVFWQQLNNGASRKSCDLFMLIGYTWEYYEYRIKRGYSNAYEYYSSEDRRRCEMSRISGGDRRFKYCWSIDEGAEYLEKIGTPEGYNDNFIYYTWSDKALNATKKFRISAHLAPSATDVHNSLIKRAYLDINPNDVTLIKYSSDNQSN